MKKTIALAAEHLKIVTDILADCLPSTAHVWLFGSRSTGNAKPFSDIDLLVDVGHPMSLEMMTKLSSAFDESTLPYKVDIADIHSISDGFKANIAPQLISIQ